MNAIEELKGLIEGNLADMHARVKEAEDTAREALKKAQRPGFGAGLPGSGQETTEQRKCLDRAYRALVAGDQAKADIAVAEYKSMTAGSDPEGGYFVSPELSTMMTQRAIELSPVSALARTISLRHGDSFEEVADVDSAGATWVGEIEARPETKNPDIGKATIYLRELYAMPKVSQKLIDVADIDVVAWLNAKVATAFALAEGEAFMTGDGVKRPRGILDYDFVATGDATRPWGEIQYVPTGNASGFDTSAGPADALIDTVYAVKTQYRANACWLMTRATASKIRKFKDGMDNYLWVPGLQPGEPERLLNFPVHYCEDLPEVEASKIPILFGDFQAAYTIIRRPGIKLLVDPYTDKPNVRLYSYGRVGGGLVNSEAIKGVKIATS